MGTPDNAGICDICTIGVRYFDLCIRKFATPCFFKPEGLGAILEATTEGRWKITVLRGGRIWYRDSETSLSPCLILRGETVPSLFFMPEVPDEELRLSDIQGVGSGSGLGGNDDGR